ncbi:hypothetical protein LSAT2_030737 [Lamellibrachia satsuma]|nr:hypothetical protein LSAT2_030737 [Lamellibrachia satsuma]
MHETDCKEDQSDNDVIFVRHTHGKTGNTGDIKVVDDDGMWDEDVIFVRHTRGKTSRNLPATTSMKHSRKIPTAQSVIVEKKHKARHFDDSQYDMSSPDTDSSDQSLPSQKGCSCNGIPGRQLCPPCAVELDKCKTKSVSKHPATTPKPAEDSRSVRSTWPPVAVKQESTCGDGTGLWPHNTAELSNHKLDYVNQKCVTVSKLTGDELPNEATWPTAIVKQDPSKCPSTVTATSGENSSSEPSQLPKHPNEATWTSAIVRQESSKCPTAMTGENRSSGASQLASRVKQEGSHSTPAEEPLSSYPKTYTDDGAYNSKRTFDYTASSTSDTSIVLSKKQRLAPSTCQPLSSTLGLSHLDTPSHHGLCYGCGTLVPIPDLSQCPKAHWGCSQCLQKQAKSLLTKQSKGSLKCLCPECECVYSLSELHKVLPPIVVEMLEEKLTVESLESTTNLGDKPKLGKVSRRQIHDKTKVDALTLPQSWEPMDINGEMKIVDILPDSDRYQNLLVKFHKTLHAPMACITRIRRVQNPVLWKFYSVKRKQMLHENGAVDLREYYLFHGTSKRVISAICKNNFDCRLCGMNGTTYGQGSYFAVDARYAHKFTDGGDPMRRAWLWSKMQTSQHPTQTVGRQASPMLTQIRQQLAHARQQLTHASLQPTQTVGTQASPMLTHIRQQLAHARQQLTHASLQPTQTSQQPTQTVGTQASPMLTHIRQQLAHARQQLTHASLQPTQTSQQPTHASLQPTQTSQPQTQANQRPQSILPNNLRLLFDTPKRDTVRTRHTMFVARVLVGKYALGSRDFRKPPPLDASKPYEKCFDSCVNDTNNPHIYVVFDNAQCYPEYVIDYTME